VSSQALHSKLQNWNKLRRKQNSFSTAKKTLNLISKQNEKNTGKGKDKGKGKRKGQMEKCVAEGKASDYFCIFCAVRPSTKWGLDYVFSMFEMVSWALCKPWPRKDFRLWPVSLEILSIYWHLFLKIKMYIFKFLHYFDFNTFISDTYSRISY